MYRDCPSAFDRGHLYKGVHRNGKNIDPVTTWTYWPIDVEGVQSVKFNFAGSDSDETFGLNTPAYICIDDITVQ